jgi:transcriptional regulator with XRE-family HTH domain
MKSLYTPAYQALLAWLRSQREAQGLTLRAVGARMGLPHSWVGKVETGERRLDVTEYVRLCHALGAEPGRGLAVVEAALRTYQPAEPVTLLAAEHPTAAYVPPNRPKPQRPPSKSAGSAP